MLLGTKKLALINLFEFGYKIDDDLFISKMG